MPRQPIVLLALALAATARSQSLGSLAEPFDRVGAALARGDFNGDGLADLAIGVPGDTVRVTALLQPPFTATFVGAGAVHMLFGSVATGTPPSGSPTGLRVGRLLRQAATTATTPGAAAGNAFGSALAVGDFDGDGLDDLAIGVPGQTIGALAGAGAVVIVYGGSASRLLQTWSQDSAGVVDAAESGDGFGAALAAGDFDGDGFDDLAIAAPFEDLAATGDAGLVHVLRGAPGGLTTTGASAWAQGNSGLADVAEPRDAFGLALAAGDLNADGCAELAIGVPFEAIGTVRGGAVHVVFGARRGLTATGNQFWHQDVDFVAGVAAANESFGAALVIADFDGDGFGDLAIGVPQEITDGLAGGGVNVLFGSATGASVVNNQLITQNTENVIDDVRRGDRFGASLSTWRPDPTSRPLLAVGIPGELQGGVVGAGGLEFLGLSQTSVGFCAFLAFPFLSHAANDALGSAVACGDFNGDGFEDIAAGIPDREVSGVADAGMVYVTYPRYFAADRWRQGQ